MISLLFRFFLWFLQTVLRSKDDLAFENLALRQQINVLQRKVKRPKLQMADRLFWVALRRAWPRWSDCLAIVKPQTVVAWH